MIDKQANQHFVSLDYYSIGDISNILTCLPSLSLKPEVTNLIKRGSAFVLEKAAEDRYIYGVNTGFGSLCETRIKPDEMETLQRNLLLSHSAGVGPNVSEKISRLCMFIKLLTFRTGRTGISIEIVDRMVELWNLNIIPTIPKKGSVGASGDLAPLAHMALPLIGLGSVHYKGNVVSTSDVLDAEGLEPLKLKPKEGLALTNGVQYINAMGVDSLIHIEQLVRCADLLAAISSQAFSTSRTYYQELYQSTSYHLERAAVARNLTRLLQGSNHWELPTCNKSMQDPYSFRCIPQVHAAVRQAFGYAKDIIEKECNSVSDNPLFFPEEDQILFGGALHGESTAMTLDFLAIAVSELCSISERRTYQLLSGTRGLPDFLVSEPGLNSGYMIAQYTSAALVNENKCLSSPASVDTIATCQLQEDHVSMGPTAGFKLETVRENCEHIFAIELLLAAQAIELNKGLRLSPITSNIVSDFRAQVPHLDVDRVVAIDIQASLSFLKENLENWSTELGLE